MSKLRLKSIEEKIIEIDFSETTKEFKIKTIEECIKEIETRFKFEDDKTQMNEMIKQIQKQKIN